MERLLQEGPLNSYLLGEHSDHEESVEKKGFVHKESLRLYQELYNSEHRQEEEEEEALSFEEKMPFLQMLQSVENQVQVFPFKEANFQKLLMLQHLKRPLWDANVMMDAYFSNILPEHDQQQLIQVPSLDQLESCVTHDNVTNNIEVVHDSHSPIKSEPKDLVITLNPPNSDLGSIHYQHDTSLEPASTIRPPRNHHVPRSSTTGEHKKRKWSRPAKNKEEMESQRMTHIAVERNRRCQMNDHLKSLRSLMPLSHVQRGDQASIIGGAIDFVKELEQLLHSLEAQKRLRKQQTEPNEMMSTMLPSPNCNTIKTDNVINVSGKRISSEDDNEALAKKKSEDCEIQVNAIQDHVNLKIECQRNPGQLLRAIIAFDELRLSVLHLNISSSQSTVLYSFNLKIEEECKLRSADEVTSTVHQIFKTINGS